MADKKITDLTLRSAVVDTVNFPGDDTIQTYRLTALQIWEYIFGKQTAVATISAAGTVLTSANKIVLLNPTALSFTQALPAASGCSGWMITFKNIATNGNTATLDASTTELIDNDLTLELGSSPTLDSVTLYCNGTKWYVL